MENIKNILKNNLRQYAMLIVLVLVIIYFQIATGGILLVPMNVTNLIMQNAYVFILAIGMTLCILTGGNIDLSAGSVVAFLGAIAGICMINMKWGLFPTIAVTLLMGLAIGFFQAYWIAYVEIPPFIVTMAGMLIFRGLTITMLKGLTLSPFPESFQQLSNGFIPGIGKIGNLDLLTIVLLVAFSLIYIFSEVKKRAERKKNNFQVNPLPLLIAQIVIVLAAVNIIGYWLAAYKGLPIVFVLILVLVIAYSFYTLKTIPGRYLYALGGNKKAASLSGIDTRKVMFFAYTNMAVLASVAALVTASRLNAASPQSGVNFEMDAISSCFLGGCSAYGGVGTVVGAIIGALFMGVLNNGMSIMGVGSDWQMTIKGIVLLAAVAFDVFSKKKSK